MVLSNNQVRIDPRLTEHSLRAFGDCRLAGTAVHGRLNITVSRQMVAQEVSVMSTYTIQ